MPKIITITFNPTIDKSTSITALVPEKKLQCTEPHFEPGGGGVNVARAIKKLGGEATAIYPSGGYSGAFLNELMSREGVPIKVIDIQSHTRENLIVFDRSTGQQYRFGMPGSEVREEEWHQVLKLVEEAQANFIIASGSLPPGVPPDIFGQIAAIAKKQEAKLFIDTSGEALKKAVEAGVYLVKPNLSELSSLVGIEEVHHEKVYDIARDIIGRNCCKVVMVSLGAVGAMMITRDEVFHAIPPVVKRLSTVGAGDSMMAGVVVSLARGSSLKEALQYGVACGTAATLNPGTELCKREDVEKLYPLISFPFAPRPGSSL
ncbi:MAG: 1-phosphofructokinase family hexose kinase [Flavisolibacter sp.]